VFLQLLAESGADTYTIRVDTVQNRRHVTLVGFFSFEEIKKCGDETIEATKRLRPGYDVVADITQYKAGPPEMARDIERVQAHFRKAGAHQGVRIVGGNSLSGMQFRRTGTNAEYNSVNVPSPKEAEKLLSDPWAARLLRGHFMERRASSRGSIFLSVCRIRH
jgi:hypothetical protein